MKKIVKLLISVLVSFSIFLLSGNIVKAEVLIGSEIYREKISGALWWAKYDEYGLRVYHTGDAMYAYPSMIGGLVYHTQNGGDTVLTVTLTETFGYSDTYSMNNVSETGIEAAGIKLSASTGYGRTTGFSYSFSRASGVARTIPSDKATGEYAFAVYSNSHQCRGEKWDVSFAMQYDTWSFDMPYGMPGFVVICSTDNQNSWNPYYD